VSNRLKLEQTRAAYWKKTRFEAFLWVDQRPGQLVAALTGLTYAFAQSLESTAKKGMKQEDAEREVSKLVKGR